MKTKILYIIENVFFGGGERSFAQIINGLDKDKYEIYVACMPRGKFVEKIRNSANILPINFRNMFNLFNICKLTKIMKENNIQIVHSQGGRADFFARLAARKAMISAVVSTVAMPVEGYDVSLFKKVLYVILDRFSERFVSKFIVVSEALRKRLIKIHRVPFEKIVKICNGVELDLDTGLRTSDIRNKLKLEFMIPEDAILIGVIGRLVWQKGLTYFIRAIKQILDDRRQLSADIRFIIVGEGNKRKSLEHTAKKLGIEENVVFTGFRNDAERILKALDILVLPSVLEGQPIVLLEAMAMGKAIVATNIEGVNETVDNGVTGVLIPPGDSGALAEAIVCLLKDNKKAQEMADASRLAVEKNFTINQMIEKTENVYHDNMIIE